MRIYCGSVTLIYWIDHVGSFHLRAETRVLALQAAGDRITISDRTRLECRVGPLKRKDPVTMAAFDQFFGRPNVLLVPLSAAVFERAAQLRADLGFKTPDAIHLAASIEAHCDCFLTSDAQLTCCADILVEVLP
jgi:predicted nucleic acid-binding protein